MGPLLEAFDRQVVERRHGEALCSRGEGLRLSFADLAARVDARVERLRRAGFDSESRRGQVVGLSLPNRVAFCEVFFALRRLGIAVALLDGALGEEERWRTCRRLGISSTVVAGTGVANAVPGSTEWAGEVVVEEVSGAQPSPLPPGTEIIKVTSGSTGEPAGICFGEEALFHGIENIAAGMDLSAEDRILLAIPLSHSYGFDNGILSLAVLGTCLMLEPSYFPGVLLRSARQTRATVLPLVPPLVHGLTSAPWPEDLALRLVISAGGPLLPGAAQRFAQASGRPVQNFFGSSETGGITFEDRPEEADAAGTVGRPLPGVEIRLDDEGAVFVRSRALLLGRLGEESRPRDEVETGDLGRWAPGGRLQLLGRRDRLFKLGGRKISQRQLEDSLLEIPQVEAAAVVAIEDPVRGERAVAFLVARTWPIDNQSLPLGLAAREVRRIETLPFTERGKLDRRRLRELAKS